MTNQELYSTVRKHLLTQMAQSMRPRKRYCDMNVSPGCAYRGVGGLKCAIGCVIPDDRYQSDMEGISASAKRIREAAGYAPEQERLAQALQCVHDNSLPDKWEAGLDDVAKRYRLEPK